MNRGKLSPSSYHHCCSVRDESHQTRRVNPKFCHTMLEKSEVIKNIFFFRDAPDTVFAGYPTGRIWYLANTKAGYRYLVRTGYPAEY
jgi:hypothetical protein